jgi:hypothetical protein
MAERGAVAARHDRGEPAAVAVRDGVAHGEDAAVEPVEPPARHPAAHGRLVEAEPCEIADADDPVLSCGELGEPHVAWGC